MMHAPADLRSRTAFGLPAFIPSGPGDLGNGDSFLLLVMTEPYGVSAGLKDVQIYGAQGTHTVRVYCPTLTADTPGGYKYTHMEDRGCYTPGRPRPLHGVMSGTRYYYPPVHPRTGEVLLGVSATLLALRTAT